ncbi:GroES-like protein [Testicularia cyperi]|uniref:GroES-like protein n=1 Tax=Testicularia cyperi TaxID=1882483 RepID=A0A317XH32_9BASI|nr:GroES-like protein [Testicularia cyperi]PWY97579.1 GroES-like protein [Testicularia cyperi]
MSLPSTFKAAVVPEPGAQHTVVDRSLAPLADDEVAVKITATAVNPVDWKIRDYKVFITEYPAVLGSDAAGEVVSVGSGVKNVTVGERVFFQGIIGKYDSSTFQQYAKIPAALVSKTPRKVSDEQAATFWVAGMAAATGLYHKTGVSFPAPWDKDGDKAGKGKAAVILGGSSSVGQYAIQLAKLSGFERIVTNASAGHASFLKTLGADVVLDRKTQNSASDFVSAVGDGLDVTFVYDSISFEATQTLAVEILQNYNGGRVITVTQPLPPAIEAGQKGDKKVVVQQILGIGSGPEYRYVSEPLAHHLGGEEGYIAQGKIVLNRPEVVAGGLANIEQALQKNKEGVSGVKVVFQPHEA